jgi:hypothetical protein
MRNRHQRFALLVFAFCCVTVTGLHAQPANVTATAKADTTRMMLSENTRVTLSVEGRVPLRVELPAKLLTADANRAWRIRPVAAATVTQLPNERERWEQVYRLDPIAVGELAVRFSPATVNGNETDWPLIVITVNKTLEDANPASARPVTTIEDVALIPPVEDRSPVLWVVSIVAVACAIVAGVAFTRKRPVPASPPAEWAMAELAQLQPTEDNGLHIAERIAAIVRTFVERRDTIPATKLTTAELANATHALGWPRERIDTLLELLNECDLAKFANTAPTRDRCEQLLTSVRRIVTEVSHDGQHP